jgi:hypothetical protein
MLAGVVPERRMFCCFLLPAAETRTLDIGLPGVFVKITAGQMKRFRARYSFLLIVRALVLGLLLHWRQIGLFCLTTPN